MLVRNWMTPDPITIVEDTSMMEASQLMREKGLRRLPVVNKKGALVGIVSDRDIKDASPSKATTLDVHELYYLLSKLKIKEVMSRDPLTIHPDSTVEKAALIMMDKRISGLPVIDDAKNLVGILTQGDVFKVLTRITGVMQGGVQLAFELDDRPGSIKEVADVIRAHGGRMTSILTSYETASGSGKRNVFFRVQGFQDKDLPAIVEEMKSKFNFLYYVQDDMRAK
jgi:acetoin utilization protein AcuB